MDIVEHWQGCLLGVHFGDHKSKSYHVYSGPEAVRWEPVKAASIYYIPPWTLRVRYVPGFDSRQCVVACVLLAPGVYIVDALGRIGRLSMWISQPKYIPFR